MGGEGGGRLMAARSEAGPETWKSGWLRRILLVTGRSKLLPARKKKDVGHGSGAGCRADC